MVQDEARGEMRDEDGEETPTMYQSMSAQCCLGNRQPVRRKSMSVSRNGT